MHKVTSNIVCMPISFSLSLEEIAKGEDSGKNGTNKFNIGLFKSRRGKNLW